MQTTRYRSMALRRDEIGASSLEMKFIVKYVRRISHLTLLNMLIRTKKRVTRRAILPGTTSGLIKKLTQLTMTNMKLGR